MAERYQTHEVILNRKYKHFFLVLVLILFVTHNIMAEYAQRINFKRGAISGEWSGWIYNGRQDFLLNLKKGQTLTVKSPDIYCFKVVAPSGLIIGENACRPEEIFLEESGDYQIITDYRMSSGADSPVIQKRFVNVVFTVY